MAQQPSQNLLAGETSPYLRQHSNNPVHWRPWSETSLAEAAALNKPILLSVGYAACHWCHVMAHESFESDEVAAVMNRLFVNIKVDREERPDIDQIYMAALTAMGEQGGWPMTMFLTPKGLPFWGGTYFPNESRYGRPGFIQVLEAVNKAWVEKSDSLRQSANRLTAHVQSRLATNAATAELGHGQHESLANTLRSRIDSEEGGLSGAPKFPNAPFIQALWLDWLRNKNTESRGSAIKTLEKIVSGGIYDHIGGGLCRYSTDDKWIVPHFEKMLYDNAQLIRQLLWVYAETQRPLFRQRIEQTVDWLLREMRVDGAFASSLDADNDGEEGKFYTWTSPEIEQVLGEDSSFFFNSLILIKPDSWEGDPILCAKDNNDVDPAKLDGMKTRLLAAREKRVRPDRDDKILTDWNGLLITALAEAGRVVEKRSWTEAASLAFRSIDESAKDDRLPHSRLGDSRLFPGLSSDYAAMINAAVALYEATGDKHYIDRARVYVIQLDTWYADEAGTGYYLTASDSRDTPMRIRGDVDDAVPSATSQIIEALVRLSSAAADVSLLEKAWTVAEHAAGRIASQVYGQAGILNAVELLLQPKKLVILEDTIQPSLVSVANQYLDPRRVNIVVALGKLEEGMLPLGAALRTDKQAAYLCNGPVCLPPISDPAELAIILQAG